MPFLGSAGLPGKPVEYKNKKNVLTPQNEDAGSGCDIITIVEKTWEYKTWKYREATLCSFSTLKW